MSSFLYGIKQGIKNVFRNRLFSLASIGTITACLFIFGIFYCMVMNFQHIFSIIADNSIRTYNNGLHPGYRGVMPLSCSCQTGIALIGSRSGKLSNTRKNMEVKP